MLAAMDEVPTIRLEAASRHIRILLHHRPYPTAAQPWDRDAISATVQVQAGAFHGALATTVWSHELLNLGRLLLDLYEHVGTPRHEEFRLLEVALRLTLDLSRIGHLQVHVEAHELGDDPRLSFVIGADQTFLPIWHLSIMEALEYYPPQL